MINRLYRLRIELGVLLAIGMSMAAFVFVLSANGGRANVTGALPESPQVSAVQAVSDDAREVNIYEFRYNPDPVRVPAGSTIAWSNSDATPHTVTADDGSWGSANLAQGDGFIATFDEPGVYAYYCVLHPPAQLGIVGGADEKLVFGGGGHGMQGTIIVE